MLMTVLADPLQKLRHWSNPLFASPQKLGAQLLGTQLAVCAAIVASLAVAPSRCQAQDLKAQTIEEWDFQRADDRNNDREPDGWRRRIDRQHPSYIEMEIVSRDPERAARAISEQQLLTRVFHAARVGYWDPNYVPEAPPRDIANFMDHFVLNNCLEIRMDGGAAELVSPPFPLDPRFSYSLSAELSSVGLDGHKAWAELQLLDHDRAVIESIATSSVSGTFDWEETSTAVTEVGSRLRWGRVHLVVQPEDRMLISGTARFDAIKVHRLPRLTLTAGIPHHLARPGEEFEVECTAMGISGSRASVRMEVRDCEQRLLRAESVQLKRIQDPLVPTTNEPAAQHFVAFDSAEAAHNRNATYDGRATWRLKFDQPGAYHVHVNLGTAAQQRDLVVAVIDDNELRDAGPFGWSIDKFDNSVAPQDIPELVKKFGAGWVRFPIWFSQEDKETADKLVAMAEALQQQGSTCVGVFDQPPEEQRPIFGEGTERLHAISIFRDPKAWEPVIEPVLTRMGLKIDWFQLGTSQDLSFVGVENLGSVITDIRTHMQTYSQELKLAFTWTWLDQPPKAEAPTWNSLHYTSTPALTARELYDYASGRENRQEDAWVSLNPLPSTTYSLLDRVGDLTQRMISVKRANVKAAFVENPFDLESGLFDERGRAGEMVVPWRTIALHLGPEKYAGSIRMPNGSPNHLFGTGKKGVMVLWSDTPTEEQLYYGESVTAVDVWGRKVDVEQTVSNWGAAEQRIFVDRWPIFVSGVNIDVCKWRQRVELELSNLASTIDATQSLPITLENTLSQTATGKVTVVSPTLLRNAADQIPIQLTTGVSHTRQLPINLKPDASAGKHEIRLDFEVKSDREYKFSVYRDLMLGLGDVEFNFSVSRRNAELVELRVELINNTIDPLDFDCKFFPAGQPYQRFQILEAKRGSTLREVMIPLAEDLDVSQAWIRCEQIGTGRVLNYRLSF